MYLYNCLRMVILRRKGETMRKKWALALLCAVLAGVMFTGCVRSSGGGAGGWDDPIKPTPSPTEPTEPPISVETPYGELCYSARWSETMEARVTEEETYVKVDFYGTPKDTPYLLFTLTIGEGVGESVGTLTDAGGTKRKVYAEMPEIPELWDLPLRQQEQLFAMQEEINIVIQYLK